jgi:AAA15 family ATPase/GTPase
MKIIKLESDNVMRLNSVQIEPDGSLIIIGGANGAGKSSVLNSIAMALGGGAEIVEKPLHEGAESGETTLWFDENIVVNRRYNKTGTTSLTVQTKEGAKFTSPQQMLDSLVGKLTFDPLNFARMKPDEQKRVLCELAQLDFTKEDTEHAAAYEERTIKGREVKRIESVLAGKRFLAGVADEEVSASELNDKLRRANEKNSANAQKRLAVSRLNGAFRDASQDVTDQKTEVKRIEKLLETAQKELEKRQKAADAAKTKFETERDAVAAIEDEDTTEIVNQLTTIEETNAQIRANKEYTVAKEELAVANREHSACESRIEMARMAKEKKLRAAKFPIPGLGLHDLGVTFDGKPFSQASAAEQLRVSVAMGMAANPQLRILLCRDGSLLDDKSLKLLADIVKENDFQCWLEKVSVGDECSVIIEDGYVKAAKPKKTKTK